MLLLIGISGIFAIGINSTAAASTSVYVNTHGNNSWDGQSATWNGKSGPKLTIINATGTVSSGGTVHIASGTYKENKININKNMNIIGANQQNTIIDGKGAGSVFNILTGVKVNISNLRITHGNASTGGAIQNNGILTVKNSTFTYNNAYMGGAIYNINILNLSSCTFTGNTATYGGAIYNDNILNIVGGSFNKNTALNCGGSVYNYYTTNNNGTLKVTGTSFSGNNAIYGGAIGAISHFGTLIINSSTFTGNNATWGGAIYNGDLMYVKNSTLNSNIAKNGGGAIFNEGTAYVYFNQIIKNTAKTQGSAIFNDLGTAHVSLNWWGTNSNPSNNVYGTKIYSWLILTLHTNPKTIKNNGYSAVTADLRHDNSGTIQTSYLPNGIIVTFTTTLGTITSQAKTTNGIAKSTLKSGSKAGTATISAKTGYQTLKTSVTIKDSIPPKVSSTAPSNQKTRVSKTATIVIKFNEYIKASTYINKITVKNLRTGKITTITKTLNTHSNTLYIKNTKTRTANTWYQVTIPRAAIKDYAGNNLQATYTFKFKTGT